MSFRGALLRSGRAFRSTRGPKTHAQNNSLDETRFCSCFNAPFRGSNCGRSEEHTSELQSLAYLVCRLLLEKKHRLSAQRPRHAARTASHCGLVIVNSVVGGPVALSEPTNKQQRRDRSCVLVEHAAPGRRSV